MDAQGAAAISSQSLQLASAPQTLKVCQCRTGVRLTWETSWCCPGKCDSSSNKTDETVVMVYHWTCKAYLRDQLVIAQDIVRPLQRLAEEVLPLLGLPLVPGHHAPEQLTQHPA